MRWHWQYLIGILIFILNVDLVLVPLLKFKFGINGWSLFWIILILANMEMYGWYWFWGWWKHGVFSNFFAKRLQDKRVQEVLELGKDIRHTLTLTGQWQKAKDFFFNVFAWATDDGNRFLKRIKRGGYPVLFFMAVEPLPGGRTVGVVFCGMINWRGGLLALMLGNAVHVGWVVGLVNWIF